MSTERAEIVDQDLFDRQPEEAGLLRLSGDGADMIGVSPPATPPMQFEFGDMENLDPYHTDPETCLIFREEHEDDLDEEMAGGIFQVNEEILSIPATEGAN